MALDPVLAEKLRNKLQPVENNDMLSSIRKVTSKYKQVETSLASEMPYTMGGALRPDDHQDKKLSFSVDSANTQVTPNTTTSMSGSTPQTIKPEDVGIVSKIGTGIADAITFLPKELSKEFARFSKSALNSPRSVLESVGMIDPKERDKYGAWSTMETYQEGVERRMEEGDSRSMAIAKTFGQVAVEEPVGYAFKPLFFGVGMIWRGLRILGKEPLEQFFEGVARSKSEDDIYQMIRRVSPEVPEDEARIVSRQLVNVDNVDDVRKILQDTGSKVDSDISKGISEVTETGARTADEAIPTVARTADEAVPTVARTADEVSPAIAKATDDLAQAAAEMKRVGKTFNDFVKSVNSRAVDERATVLSERVVKNNGIIEQVTKLLSDPSVAKDTVATKRFEEIKDTLTKQNNEYLQQKELVDSGYRGDVGGMPYVKDTNIPTRDEMKKTWDNVTIKNDTPTPTPTPTPTRAIPLSTVGSKERRFVTSVKRELPEVGKKIIDGQYIPRSTDELARDARELIEKNLPEAQRIAKEGTDDKAVATAVELLKYYNEKELYDQAAELAMEIAPKLTELGRAVQAASILSNLTPEGQIKLAARAIERWNKAHPGRPARPLGAEEVKHITREMKEIQAMNEGIDKAIRFHYLQKYIDDLVPSPWWRKVVNAWKAGLLTGLKTTGLNIFSNVAHAISETAKDVPASIVDSVASLFTGKRTKTFTTKGYGGGIKKGFERGWMHLKTGFDERNLTKKLDYRRISYGKGPVGRMFQTYTDSIFRVMGATDQPTYYGAVARSIADQSIALGKTKGLSGKELDDFVDNLIQNPTEDIMIVAINDGKTAVFQQDTWLGNLAKSIQRAPGMEFIVPFAQTPSAVATQIFNYTPIGTASEIIKQIAKKQFDQRKFSEAVGRGLVGTAVLAIGYELLKNDMVTLDFPDNEREREQWKLEGRKPNTILIDGKWRSPIVLGPAGNLLLAGAHFGNAYEETGSLSGAASQGSFGALKSFSEQTFLTGISSFANALDDPERNGTSFLAGLVSSVVPTIVSDIARASDPVNRRTADKSAFTTIYNRILARIPVLRQELEPVMNTLGEEQKREGSFLETMLDPTRPSRAISSPVIDEFRRLSGEGYDISPTLQGNKIGYDTLTPAQNTIMWAETGSVTREKVEKLVSNPAYQALSDEEKAKKIDEFITKSKDVGRARTINRLTQGMTQDEYLQALKYYKHEGTGQKLLTESVYRELVKLQKD